MNETLQSAGQWQRARDLAAAADLRPTKSEEKNWCYYLIAEDILKNLDQNEKIVIFGQTIDEFASWLVKLGYKDIIVADPSFKMARQRDNESQVQFYRQTPGRTTFGTQTIGAVIELFGVTQGLRLDLFYQEAHRYLKPSGRLYQVADYWPKQLDTVDRFLDEQQKRKPVILSRATALHCLQLARDCGFRPSTIPRLQAEEAVVYWRRMDLRYTFLLFGFIRDRESHGITIEEGRTEEAKTPQESQPSHDNLRSSGEREGAQTMLRSGHMSPQRNTGGADMGALGEEPKESISRVDAKV